MANSTRHSQVLSLNDRCRACNLLRWRTSDALKPYMQIRELTKTDAIEYRTFRLRALKEHPMAFSSSYDDQRDWPLEIFAERLSETPGSGD